MLKTAVALSVGCGVLAALLPLHGHAAETFVPADFAKPSACPAHFEYQAADGSCKALKDEIATLKSDACAGDGVLVDKATGKCVSTDPAPAPLCKPIAGRSAKISGAGAKAACSYEATLAASGRGDYVGDCFETPITPSGMGLKAGRHYLVTGQKSADDDDRELTLVDASPSAWYRLGCEAVKGGAIYRGRASGLIEAGAVRQGYAYGFLTMPYRYFPGDKSFVTGVPIGGYIGWRAGQAGSGRTVAAAVTLGSVKANTVDPTRFAADGKTKLVTGTSDVAALSFALGMMFDILKSPAGKPFKAGMFVGADIVSNDAAIDYRFNRKPWIAIQLGYDFTDN